MRLFFVVYDGTAMTGDTENSAVLEVLGFQFTWGDYAQWQGTDAVLVSYEETGPSEVGHERIVGHFREGYDKLCAALDTLRSQIAAGEAEVSGVKGTLKLN